MNQSEELLKAKRQTQMDSYLPRFIMSHQAIGKILDTSLRCEFFLLDYFIDCYQVAPENGELT